MLIRGLETLDLRVKQHSENALAVARWLSSCTEVAEVYYPGLPTHEHYELAKAQQRYFGGVVSFRLKQDNSAAATQVVSSTKIFKLAESLGGIKSLIAHPTTMTHASIPVSRHADFGISGGLIRLSVGLEDAEDLIDDLALALHKLTRTTHDEPKHKVSISA